MIGCSSTLVNPLENNGILVEKLVKINPKGIFKCIIVSKQWLKVITSSFFREIYTRRWRRDFDPVGFLVYEKRFECFGGIYSGVSLPPAVQFWPTSALGKHIIQSKFLHGRGHFIATSNGLILSGCPRNTYYVCNPATKQQVKLPPPPKHHFELLALAFLRSDNDELVSFVGSSSKEKMCFKVIQAKGVYTFEGDRDTVPIRTFSSRTGEWKQSTLTGCASFNLLSGVATVTRGVVYWTAVQGRFPCIAAYDTKENDNGRITLIKYPSGELSARRRYIGVDDRFGSSHDGLLQYATWDIMGISIGVLDDETVENYQIGFDASDISDHGWNLLHRLDFILGTRYEFASFHPHKSDSIFLKRDQQFFLYHFDRKMLEKISRTGDDDDVEWCQLDWDIIHFQPLLAWEYWPCSPSSP